MSETTPNSPTPPNPTGETQYGPRVAGVGSPSSNYHLSLDVGAETRNQPLVGAMLSVVNPMGEGEELAIGTVTQVTTSNRWHEDPAFRGIVNAQGEIRGMSGDSGDTRNADIHIQAAWRRDTPHDHWVPSGPSLSMSPATGTPVHVVSQELIDTITATSSDLHYLGHMLGTDQIRLPLSIPDFSSHAGAFMTGVYGRTGSGKSAATAYLLAGQCRFTDMAMLIVDPQQQWSHEEGLPFSLQGWAQELGRDVLVRRISEDIRLNKDAGLFTELLEHTKLLFELRLKHENTKEIVWYEIMKALRGRSDWTETPSHDLLTYLLGCLATDDVASRVYTTPENQMRFQERVNDMLANPDQFAMALNQFAPIHNLFQDHNPNGGERYSLTGTLSRVFDREHGKPAPIIILDMSTQPPPSLDEMLDEETENALEILDQDSVKASILRHLFHSLKRVSEHRFREGRNLNTLVVLDEAWRYAPPPAATDNEEIIALSRDLAGYARDTRKFGIGWLYISQATRSINPDIWAQMSVRIFGYGLNGHDLDKISEVVDEKSTLRLYRTFSDPRQSGKYPFMITGPVSPLAANSTPVMIEMYTDFDDFRQDNHHWIAADRARQGKPVLTGPPTPPEQPTPGTNGTETGGSKGANGGNTGKGVNGRHLRAVGTSRADLRDSSRAATTNRHATGTRDTDGFANPLDSLDDDPIPF